MSLSRINPAFAVVLAVLAVVGTTWWATANQRAAADRAFDEMAATQETLVTVAEQELGIQTYAQHRSPALLDSFVQASLRYERVNRDQIARHEEDRSAHERELMAREDRLVARWRVLADKALLHLRDDPTAEDRTLAVRLPILRGVRAANAAVQRHIVDEQHHDQAHASTVSVVGLSLMGVVLGGGGLALVSRNRRQVARRREDEERRAREQALFREVLQLAPNESEAHEVIGSHLRYELPVEADVSLMRRNNSQDRLEVVAASGPGVLPLPQGSEHPMACLAMKLNRPYERGEGPDYLTCDLCGKVPGASTCAPVLVAGEVIGAVTVHTPERLGDQQRLRVAETIDQAAPVLSNLRNLAVAETRAATDALTGLPNRRTIGETLHRMVAHAGRTVSPLSAVMLDLDHFKQVNDLHGHEHGDAVLAAVAGVLRSGLRASDFAGRNGGEEFVVLLPDTGLEGANEVAAKLRLAVERLEVPPLDRGITASFGVAVYPDHATDAETLMRNADRALYAAKRGGRNRVETVAAVTRA